MWLHGDVVEALSIRELEILRATASTRDLARLHSCSGPVSGRWLSEYPASWWPRIGDDSLQMALRWRVGLPVVRDGAVCCHRSCGKKCETEVCGAVMDIFGDHCLTCNIGPFRFARHAAINSIISEAGRDAGYAVLEEQVVPELCQSSLQEDGSINVNEARLDIEMFLHPTAPDRLLDGTVRHPAAAAHLEAAAVTAGVAAARGTADKARRYPPRNGKVVICCAAETWGYISEDFDNLLAELAVLAARRQRNRGVRPTKWRSRWRTQISIRLCMAAAAAILKSVA